MNLAERARRYAALDFLSVPVWIFDFDARRVHWANTEALRVWDASTLEELCGRDMGRDMSPSVARRLAQYKTDFQAHGVSFNEQWTLYPGGKPVSLEVKFSPHRLHDGRMAMICEARDANPAPPESLRSVEALLHTAVMITLYGEDGSPLYRNPTSRASVRELNETFEGRLVDPGDAATMLAALGESGVATRTLAVRTIEGERWHEVSARRCRDAVTGQNAVLVSEVDVSAIKSTEAHAQFLALHDSLTGLPNRNHVIARFTDAVVRIREAGQEAALVFLDLDHFKDVNDTLGHAAGDALLVEIAKRLRSAVRSDDLVARLGGDEFLILLVARDIHAEIGRVRERLMRTVAEPVEIQQRRVRVTPSIGVALFPRDGDDIDTLLRNADLAMYTAKERGRNELAFYESRMSTAVESRTLLESNLLAAMDRGEFEVFYQPLVDAETGRIVASEALARWRSPERGFVAPDVFIPICESTGLIRRLGALVFGTAARQQVAWAEAGHDIRVSVNLSPRQLRQAELVDDLRGAIREAGVTPDRMQLELTESMLVGNDESVVEQLRAIDAMGLGLALDDFGTGYSNLAYLQRFPIRTLKIDKSFVHDLARKGPVAELIVGMCRLMHLAIVAEGVETEEQLAWVRSQGIGLYQGYLFSRPLPAEEMTALLARSSVSDVTRLSS